MQARYMQSYSKNIWRMIKCEENICVVPLRSIKNIFREPEDEFWDGVLTNFLILRVCIWEKYFSAEILVDFFCRQLSRINRGYLCEDVKIIEDFFESPQRCSTRITWARASWILLCKYKPRLKASTLLDERTLLYFVYHCWITFSYFMHYCKIFIIY